MRASVHLLLGFVSATVLLWAAVWLWTHNLIVFAAPVGALALGLAWVGLDNAVIYPAQRARREDDPVPEQPERSDVTVPR
jgi:hypothetical protein